MRFLSYLRDGRPALGVRHEGGVLDLAQTFPTVSGDLGALLTLGEPAIAEVRRALNGARTSTLISVKNLTYLPPVWRPQKVICLGLNYHDHAAELKEPIPTYPVVFTRVATSLVGHLGHLLKPACSEQLDYEAELAFVIGRAGRHIKREAALSYVAGYSCFNDGSLRDYQTRAPMSVTMGKNFDATGGFGPEMVTPDELPDGASGLKIECRLNGRTVQSSDTGQHIFDVPAAIEIASEAMTLLPGDIITMGTPGGVGMRRQPPLWMKDGDLCEIEIERIGRLSNTVADESRLPKKARTGDVRSN